MKASLGFDIMQSMPIAIPADKLRSTLAVVLLVLVAGCKDLPGADGRYATSGRGGWDNFRAAAPADEDGVVALAPRARD
jgi:hypothetical protein